MVVLIQDRSKSRAVTLLHENPDHLYCKRKTVRTQLKSMMADGRGETAHSTLEIHPNLDRPIAIDSLLFYPSYFFGSPIFGDFWTAKNILNFVFEVV